MTISLRLNQQLQPDENGELYFEREGEELHAWSIHDGVYRHFNAFTFGESFVFRGLVKADFTALDDFLKLGVNSLNKYEIDFPRSQQIELMEMFLHEEHNVKLSAAKRGTFCELYRQLYPIFWQYAITSSSCILYDGFYGRFLSEAYLPYQSSASYPKMIEAVFGAPRRNALREGRSVDAVALNLSYVFKELLPLDLIVQEISQLEGHFGEFPLDPALYKPLKKLSLPLRRKLFRELILNYKLEGQFIQDVLELLNYIDDSQLHRLKGASNWEKLHRLLMTYCDSVESDEKICVPDALSKLTESYDGITFRPLTKAIDYAELGDWLDICIGKAGYFMRALRGESFCLVGYKDEVPYAALEMKFVKDSWRVKQLRIEHNEFLENQRTIMISIEKKLNNG